MPTLSILVIAVGLTLSMLQVSMFRPVLIIGAVTFVMAFAGAYIGEFFGQLFEKKLEIAGGILLIGMGLKIGIGQLWVLFG
jgi:putative Mn2+ efflux pump MntP